MLWLCDHVKAVWKSCLCFAKLYQRVFRSFLDLFEAVLGLGSAFNVVVFTTTTWSLWQRRNRLREHQPTWPLHEVHKRAKEMVMEFLDVQKQVHSPVSRSLWAGWSPPPEGVYKANFDATLFEHCNCVGLGVVVRDCNGDVIAALSQRITLPHSVEHAEALAASQVVTLARELCLSQLVFEGGCQKVIAAINSTGACHTLFGHIIDEVRCLSSTLITSCFVHTRREGNKIAHALARRAVLTADTDVCVEELPNDVDDVFHSETIQ